VATYKNLFWNAKSSNQNLTNHLKTRNNQTGKLLLNWCLKDNLPYNLWIVPIK